MNASAKVVLEHLLENIEKIENMTVDHSAQLVQGTVPGSIMADICPTGVQEYKMSLSFIDVKAHEAFADFLKTHGSVRSI